MKPLISAAATVVVVLVVLLSCRTGRADGAKRMYELGPPLTKLSKAVDTAVHYGMVPDTASDEEVLVLATEQDPGLREPFARYTIRVSRVDSHAVVLVCSRNGLIGLLEDVGCSAELDVHLWKSNPARPCEFTLSAEQVVEACHTAP